MRGWLRLRSCQRSGQDQVLHPVSLVTSFHLKLFHWKPSPAVGIKRSNITSNLIEAMPRRHLSQSESSSERSQDLVNKTQIDLFDKKQPHVFSKNRWARLAIIIVLLSP